MTTADPTGRHDIVAVVEHLVTLAAQRLSVPDVLDSDDARRRARELHEHTRSYLLPRARDLDAPLTVLLLGPTGSGKSTLMNTMAGHPVSQTGVLRPTTRDAVVVGTPTDLHRLRNGGALASAPADRLQTTDEGARSGLVLVDAPDVDSVEHANRELADRLVEVADLAIFVTTATRYADRVPWDVLARVSQRGLPLVVIVNRAPAGPDADVVLEDVRRLFARAGPNPLSREPVPIHVVAEGDLAATGEGLRPEAVRPLLDRIEHLVTDRQARRQLAEEALAGAIAGIGPLVHQVADDLEHEAIDADALRRMAGADHAQELEQLLERIARGGVLREEVIAQWHTFVGADQVTRLFASGIGRVKTAITSVFRSAPQAPIRTVEKAATDDLTTLIVAHADDAARRTATHWTSHPRGGAALGDDPRLWSSSPGLAAAARERLQAWISSIATDVAQTGATKKDLARGLSLGVNAGAVTIMLSVFAHTGGITGAEAGIAAATAVLNQKLLNALFGEAAVLEMIARARDGLRTALEGLMGAELARFEGRVPEGAALRMLSTELRAVVPQVSALPTAQRS